jgi:medium-chain acyl-[acyl-carrier-protein] hydrolase
VPAEAHWFSRPRARPNARLRLFCFPYAGGSASTYRAWVDDLPGEVDLWAIQLPGRETRLVDPPLDSLAPLVQALTGAVGSEMDRPSAFFGHSMGALVAFELARNLRRLGGPQPVCIFASAHRAPHLPRSGALLAQLPDAELIAELRDFGFVPEEVWEAEELMELALPMLRADFAVGESYRYRSQPPLACAISATAGRDDAHVDHEEVKAWREHTSGQFLFRVMSGDHFYLRERRGDLIGSIVDDVCEVCPQLGLRPTGERA